MWLKSVVLCVVVLVVATSQAQVVKMNKAISKTFVDEHNAARAAVNVPPLKWNDNLSKSAQNWALGCKFNHSYNGNGENLYYSFPRSTSYAVLAKKAVQFWVSEKKFVKKDWTCVNRKENTCGHYSQVVWKNTKTVGCSIVHCNGELANYVVCQYAPRGNYRGEKPY